MIDDPNAMVTLYALKCETRRELLAEMHTIAAKWRPFRTYGTLLLWGWKRQQIGFDTC